MSTNQSTKFTPGPWEYEVHELSSGPSGIVYGAHGYGIAYHLSEADARLIAAAPELLEALRYAVKCARWCHQHHPDIQKGDGVPAFLFWEEVIAKATGESK